MRSSAPQSTVTGTTTCGGGGASGSAVAITASAARRSGSARPDRTCAAIGATSRGFATSRASSASASLLRGERGEAVKELRVDREAEARGRDQDQAVEGAGNLSGKVQDHRRAQRMRDDRDGAGQRLHRLGEALREGRGAPVAHGVPCAAVAGQVHGPDGARAHQRMRVRGPAVAVRPEAVDEEDRRPLPPKPVQRGRRDGHSISARSAPTSAISPSGMRMRSVPAAGASSSIAIFVVVIVTI